MSDRTYSICELQGRAQEPIELFQYKFMGADPQIGDEIWTGEHQPVRIHRRIWLESGFCILAVIPASGVVPA